MTECCWGPHSTTAAGQSVSVNVAQRAAQAAKENPWLWVAAAALAGYTLGRR